MPMRPAGEPPDGDADDDADDGFHAAELLVGQGTTADTRSPVRVADPRRGGHHHGERRGGTGDQGRGPDIGGLGRDRGDRRERWTWLRPYNDVKTPNAAWIDHSRCPTDHRTSSGAATETDARRATR